MAADAGSELVKERVIMSESRSEGEIEKIKSDDGRMS